MGQDLVIQLWGSLQKALSMSAFMGWEILWALVLGFTLSAVIQAVVTRSQMSKWLAGNDFKSIAIATLGGAASSSCSYAAAAIARALFKQGANFTAAMAFQFASTNLVIELGILLTILLGWQFTLAQFVGGIIMINVMSLIFKIFLPKKLIAEALQHAQIDRGGSMEGHAAMHMPINNADPLLKRVFSPEGKTAISHYFFMDWSALWTDVVVGLLIAGVLSTCVPEDFWTFLLCKYDPAAAQWLNPLVGPLIAILSFVCSIGNVPMAAVLWHEGMSFGGVLSFLFADLLVLPLLDIYRKYYGWKMAAFLGVSFYVSMVTAAYCCQWLLPPLGLAPYHGEETPITHGGVYYYTTILNILALVLTSMLLKRFWHTGGKDIIISMFKKDGKNKNCCH